MGCFTFVYQQEYDQPKSKPIKAKSQVNGSNKVCATLLTTPVRTNKNTSNTKVSITPSAKVAQQQNINIYNIQEYVQSVSNLEEVVARIDKWWTPTPN